MKKCNNCNFILKDSSNEDLNEFLFCPNCGVKLFNENDNNDEISDKNKFQIYFHLKLKHLILFDENRIANKFQSYFDNFVKKNELSNIYDGMHLYCVDALSYEDASATIYVVFDKNIDPYLDIEVIKKEWEEYIKQYFDGVNIRVSITFQNINEHYEKCRDKFVKAENLKNFSQNDNNKNRLNENITNSSNQLNLNMLLGKNEEDKIMNLKFIQSILLIGYYIFIIASLDLSNVYISNTRIYAWVNPNSEYALVAFLIGLVILACGIGVCYYSYQNKSKKEDMRNAIIRLLIGIAVIITSIILMIEN